MGFHVQNPSTTRVAGCLFYSGRLLEIGLLLLESGRLLLEGGFIEEWAFIIR
jgi:hypothetical protein